MMTTGKVTQSVIEKVSIMRAGLEFGILSNLKTILSSLSFFQLVIRDVRQCTATESRPDHS